MRRYGWGALALCVALAAGCSADEQADVPAPSPSPSASAERIEVPDVAGMSWIDARDALEDAGFVAKMVGSQADKAARQTPDGGVRLAPGSPVTVTMAQATDSATTQPSADDQYRTRYQEGGGDAIGGVESAINLAKRYCENLQQNYASDPGSAVASMIENSSGMDPLGIEIYCPEFQQAAATAATGFYDGTYAVGAEIAPGTYTTIVLPGSSGTHDCYWERTTSSGGTIANDFVTLAPSGVTVTISSGEGFVSRGCGAWLPS